MSLRDREIRTPLVRVIRAIRASLTPVLGAIRGSLTRERPRERFDRDEGLLLHPPAAQP